MSDNDHYKIMQYEDILEYKSIKINERIDHVTSLIHNAVGLQRKMLNWETLNKKESHTISRSQLNSADFAENLNQGINKDYKFCQDQCSNCRKSCKLRLSYLTSALKNYSMAIINKELYEHGHPKSRISKKFKKGRTLNEAKSELYNHYLSSHLN